MPETFERHGPVAVIVLDNPPVNGLSLALRQKIKAGLAAALADEQTQAIVLIGRGRAFSGGADIREFNTPKAAAEPSLPAVVDAVEMAPKPVIAAIGGVCMGGGLELAMGCHFRISLGDSLLALPEVKLGILPGAGGTQRLPRLVSAERALALIATGDSVPARQLADTALLDQVVDGNLFEEALRFARRVIEAHLPIVPTRTRTPQAVEASVFGTWRQTLAVQAKHFPAPHRCVEAVEAALALPFDQGIALERRLFQELVATTASKALRHAFFGERAAAKLKDVPETTKVRPVGAVGVVGGGTMGSGIAMCFLNAGFPVTLLEVEAAALARGVATIRRTYENSVKKAKLSADELEARMARLKPVLAYEALAEADLIIEAVYEDLAVKEQVFRRLDQVAKAGAILATNTSTLDVNRIAGYTRRPGDVLGLHFFSPAPVMRLLEVVRGSATSPEVLATAMSLAKTIKKTAVVAGVCDGFIGNRILAAYSRQALLLLEEGALPAEVDQALEDFGMAMGPFRMGDLAGNDIGWAIRKRQQLTSPDPDYPRIADRLCEQGRFGQKTGAGWYRYAPGSRAGEVDPAVTDLIQAYRQEKGLSPRAIGGSEIVDRCILALVNEGARVLEEGIAQRASDIDMVYLCGYGFPAQRGGPMFHADTEGLSRVAAKVAGFARQTGDAFWQPAPLLARLAAQGGTFNG